MAEEKNVNTTGEQKEPEKVKKTFKEKRADFAKKYPTLTKIGKVTGKVVEYTLMAGGALLGVSMISSAASNRSKKANQQVPGTTVNSENDN